MVGRVEAWREPLLLEGSLHETIWGGQGLEIVGKRPPAGAASVNPGRPPWRASCAWARTVWRTLGELVDEWGEQLIGWRARAVYGPRFPLLTKFIDAHEWLSVQVHPDDAYAARHEGGKLGKTRCGSCCAREAGRAARFGLKRAASPAEVRAVIAATHLEELLCTFEPRPGDVVFVPAGPSTPLAAASCSYELQEYSDVTYRLYDYGRIQADGRPRALHVARALDVMRFAPHAPARVVTPPSTASSAIAQRRSSAPAATSSSRSFSLPAISPPPPIPRAAQF